MITLCGFAVSNYYNKVKLVLLEKNLAFQEELVMTGSKDEAVLRDSPLAKVPFIRTPQGAVCESQVIVEYLEQLQPEPRLLPADPFAAAKVRELCTYIELHLELVARELYGAAFFGRTVDDATKERVRAQLARNIPAFQRLARFSPFVAGETFTLADCCAFVSLPLVGMATKTLLGSDVLLEAGVDWKGHLKVMASRPSVQRVEADRKAAIAAMAKKA
ncbi:MAG: glutathione S-transferase [Betaproteobacteria bacterium]|nr:glutathione S-transferase [Betaproteobacteria bacterium]NBT11138.1 glutathione S-transferase [Betaproteobacteria bacterium]NBU50440.1 glutathione S-transferase [Betaproteobacteria bacterium]NBX95312.1 glutathione S-transferase [Betaproteobacteria bacterium]